jgi:type I restriction enzyme S subunit
MKYAAYPSYQSTDAGWLKVIPEGWRQIRGRFLMAVNPPARRARELNETDEVSFVPMESVGEYGGLNLERAKPIDEIGAGYTAFEEGDVVIAKITPCFENGKGAIAEGLKNGVGFGTTELHVLRAGSRLDRRFLFYLTISQAFRALGESEMYGAGGQKRVPPDFAKDFRIPLPPLDEQRGIVRFLDAKTAQIDALIAKKRQLIDTLKEKRQALISRAVTRGLPPEVAKALGLEPFPPTKDSGFEWLGPVPNSWSTTTLKRCGKLISGAGFPHEYQGQEAEELPFYKVADLPQSADGVTLNSSEHTVSRETAALLRAKVVPPGSIAYAKIGAALLLNRRRITSVGCCIDNNMSAFVPRSGRISTGWAYYFLSIIDFSEFMNPGAIPSFSEGYQADLPILLPPLSEQEAICAYLASETSKIDSMVGAAKAAADRLAEYRQAVISSAVTGQIDVRGAA